MSLRTRQVWGALAQLYRAQNLWEEGLRTEKPPVMREAHIFPASVPFTYLDGTEEGKKSE